MNSLTRYIFGGLSIPDSPYDFSGLGITNMYAVFKSSLANIDYFCKIKKSDNTGNEVYVFYDDNFEISMDSKISTTTTPGATSLSSFVGSDTYNITDVYCQITGHGLVVIGGLSVITLVDSGVLSVKNSKPSLFFNGVASSSLEGTALSVLDSTNDNTICNVAAIDATQTVGVIQGTSNTDTYRIQMYLDTRVNKLVGFLRDDVSGTILSEYLAQQTTTNQRRLIMAQEAQVEFKSYYNSVLQDTDAFTGNYTNDVYRIGSGTSKSTPFKGHWQFNAVFNQTLNQTQVNDLDSKLDNYFSF